MRTPDGFDEYVHARRDSLVRAAWLLTGDLHSAQDMVQVALVKTWRRWSSVRADDPDAYVRQTLYRAFVSSRRRKWAGETPVDVMPDRPQPAATDAVEDRDRVLAALRTLPTRQRAAIVLRYFEDLSDPDIAALLGVSTGTVRSQCHRGLEKLRETGQLRTGVDEAPANGEPS